MTADERFFSLAGEPGVIGSMMFDRDIIPKVLEILPNASLFYLPEHRMIFNAIVALYEAGKPIDAILLRDALEESGELERVGGAAYIAKILESVCSSASAEYYAGIVSEKAKRRKLFDVGEQIRKVIESTDGSVGASVCQIREIVAGLDDLAESNCLKLICFSDIEPKPIGWFVENKFPNGAVTIIAGDPGSTKSMLTVSIAAAASTGTKWANCETPLKKGSVIFVSDEDDPNKVIRPRLNAHGTDVSKVFILGYRPDEFFNLAIHLAELERIIARMPDLRVIFLDPITAYLGRVNANNNAEVRAVLSPLAALAARHDIAIVATNHFNKRQDLSYLYRGLGSTAFVAQARSAWGVLTDKNDEEIRMLCPIKSNYCIRPTGLKYRITNDAIQFESEPFTSRIDDTGAGDSTKLDSATDWLQNRLKNGGALSSTIFEEGETQGFKRNLLFRAKDILKVKASKEGFGNSGRWMWEIPNSDNV
jgi:hypothetical protein